MKKSVLILLLFFLCVSLFSFAHCDYRYGPVVKAAKEALANNNVNFVLIWVQQKDEKELRNAFIRTMEVRGASKKVQELADEYFFETAVRLHRTGEGETYAGIRDQALDAYLLKAASAIERKSADSLYFDLTLRIQQALDKHLLAVLTSSSYDVNDLKAARAYITHYTNFLHFLEGAYLSSSEDLIHHDRERLIAATSMSEPQDGRHQNASGKPSDQFSILFIAFLILMALLLVLIVFQSLKHMEHRRPELHS
jgi:hypothetical protein